MENKINELIDEYIRICKNKSHFAIPIKKDKNHKNYKYFEKTIEMFGKVPEFDIPVFIAANLETKIKYPAQLPTKTAFQKFRDYKDKLTAAKMGKKNLDSILIQSFENSKKIIKNRINSYDLNKFFDINNSDMSVGLALYIKGLISPYFCVICRQFWKKIDKLDPDIMQIFSLQELKNKRLLLLSKNRKLLNELKKIIGEDNWI